MDPTLIQILIEEAPALIADIEALFAKHPAVPANVMAAVVLAIQTKSATDRQIIAADQAAHPPA